ncbi:BAI1-associated protein 3-like isoform X2 [Petromyzon marinus]|uniref:BAI1-associated protein 3-like isoform X2 n=1 Tax=Petromyzon marinus TaxID=7757 RepID=A0AAJ7X6Q8_PETMA|nr:BAI1-associated protein 3-like isoform X2 [Petromyzon marinus]
MRRGRRTATLMPGQLQIFVSQKLPSFGKAEKCVKMALGGPRNYKPVSRQDLLYEEVVYSTIHQLNVSQTDASHLLGFLQQVFGKSPSEHLALVQRVREMAKPPVHMLKVTVFEATDLTPKNLDGSSNPYCTVGLALGADAERCNREFSSSESLLERLPDRTDTLLQTLNPVWDAVFHMRIDDVKTDVLTLCVWNEHNDSSLMQDISKISSWQGAKTLSKKVVKKLKRLSFTEGLIKPKQEADFLGLLNLPVRDLGAPYHAGTYRLLPRSSRSHVTGECRLHSAFLTCQRDSALSREGLERGAYEHLLNEFVEYEHSLTSGLWSGELGEDAMAVLSQHATQVDLSPLEQAIMWWFVYSDHHSSSPMLPDCLMQLLKSLEEKWTLSEQGRSRLLPDQGPRLQDSFAKLISQNLSALSELHANFPLTDPSSLPSLRDLLRFLIHLFGSPLYEKEPRQLGEPHGELQATVGTALEEASELWYNKKKEPFHALEGAQEQVLAYSRLCEIIWTELKENVPKYSHAFVSLVDVSFQSIWYQKMEKMLAWDVQTMLGQLSSSEDYRLDGETGEMLHIFHTSLHQLAQNAEKLGLRAKIPPLLNAQQWLGEAVSTWVGMAYENMSSSIQSSVQKDKLEAESCSVKHSLSAGLATSWFTNALAFWLQLAWPEPAQSLRMLDSLLQDLCNGAVFYVAQMRQKLENDYCYFSAETSIPLPKQVCTGLNSAAFVRESLSRLPQQREWREAERVVRDLWRDTGSDRYHSGSGSARTSGDALTSRLGVANQTILSLLDKLFNWISDLLLLDFRVYLQNSAKLQTVNTHDVALLLDFLRENISVLCQHLYEDTRNGLLQALWACSLRQFWEVVNVSQKHPLEYYGRLHQMLQVLLDVFYSDSQGLSLNSLKNAEYKSLENQLYLRKSNTLELIERYYQERAEEQQAADSAGNGHGKLKTGCSYDDKSQMLTVDLTDALANAPSWANGGLPSLLCWPGKSSVKHYVKVLLCPRHIFPHAHPRRTQRKMHTSPIQFEESFKLNVTMEQARAPGACLVLRLKAQCGLHKGLLGEAVLGLRSVAGLEAPAPESLHSARSQLLLPLLRPKTQESDAVKFLQRRCSEKEGKQFLKKLRKAEKRILFSTEDL